MSCDIKSALRHWERIESQRLQESRAQKPTDGLWEEFAGYRKAISMALLKEPIIGIESDIFMGAGPKIDESIKKHGEKFSTGVGGIKLDLKIVSATQRNPLRKTKIDISGVCTFNGQGGFVKIIATDNTQVEGFWSKGLDGSFSLEQIVENANIYMTDSLETTVNKNHVFVPNTDIKFIKHIVDINKQIREICC